MKNTLLFHDIIDKTNPMHIKTRLNLRYFPMPYLDMYFPKGSISDIDDMRKTRLMRFPNLMFMLNSADIAGMATITMFAMNWMANKRRHPRIITYLSSIFLFINNIYIID